MRAVLVVEFDAEESNLDAIPRAVRAVRRSDLLNAAVIYAAIREDADRVLAVLKEA